MPHTESRYQQDLGFTDAYFFIPAPDFISTGAAATLTKNAVGDISWNVAASLAAVFDVHVTDGQLTRTGFGEDLQENFGGTGIPASAQPQFYRPDVIGAMNTAQQLQPRTALKVKGFKPLSLKVVYLITGAALTLHTIRVDKTIYANNVANAITSVIANGANGLATATQANPYVTAIAFPAAQQVYNISDLSQLWIEIASTTQIAGAYRLYGVEFTVEFNYN
jgi:hypothetical protein